MSEPTTSGGSSEDNNGSGCVGCIMIIILIMLFSRCQSHKDKIEKKEEKKEIKIEQTEKKQTNVNQKEEEKKEINDYRISKEDNFSEGLAWIEFNSKARGQRCFCIDTKGDIVFTLWNGNKLSKQKPTPFELGYASYSDTEYQIYFIDTKGDITGKIESEYPIKLIAHAGGKYMILQDVETFDISEKRIGIADYNGNWLIEPNGQNEISRRLQYEEVYNKTSKFRNFEKDYGVYSMKEGMFCFIDLKQPEQIVFYNSETETDFIIENMELLTWFEDGKMILQGKETGNLYKVDKEGNSAIIASNIPKTTFNDGMYYADDKFYDINGQEILNISNYTKEKILAAIPFFSEGYGQIVLLGADERPYWILIDKQGNQLTKPVLLHEEYELYEASEGYIAVYTEETYQYFDIENRTFIDIKNPEYTKYGLMRKIRYEDVGEFQHGIAYVYDSSNRNGFYIDKNGEPVID